MPSHIFTPPRCSNAASPAKIQPVYEASWIGAEICFQRGKKTGLTLFSPRKLLLLDAETSSTCPPMATSARSCSCALWEAAAGTLCRHRAQPPREMVQSVISAGQAAADQTPAHLESVNSFLTIPKFHPALNFAALAGLLGPMA